MKVGFEEIKQYKIVDVLARYLVKVRYVVGSEYASCICPLPSHPQGDKERKFYVHLPSNRWQCKNDSCAAHNGVGNGKGEWGDVVNLVAQMEDYTGAKAQYFAAVKITGWSQKTAPLPERANEQEKQPHSPHIPENNKSSVEGKRTGYMQEVDCWLDGILSMEEREEFEEYRARIKKALKEKIYQSYKNGKAAKN